MSFIINSISESIKRSNVCWEPFPHIEVRDLFPEDYYKSILENFPKKDCFALAAENVWRLDLIPDPAGGIEYNIDDNILEPQFSFWDNFRKSYMSTETIRLFLNKFNIEENPEDLFACGRLNIPPPITSALSISGINSL